MKRSQAMQVTTYYINNIPVYIRNLPSGDIAVWHPYNLKLGSIIYGICIGHGYWDSDYKNWVIFNGFASQVISAIHARSSYHV